MFYRFVFCSLLQTFNLKIFYMTLPQKLRLQHHLFNHFDPDDDTIPTADLFNSITDDLDELGFTFEESMEIMLTVKYERE